MGAGRCCDVSGLACYLFEDGEWEGGGVENLQLKLNKIWTLL